LLAAAAIDIRFERWRSTAFPRTAPSALWQLAGTLRVDATAGQNTVTFSGRLGAHTLRPGRYRLTAIAIDQPATAQTRRG
jgi:hypothetical protein